MRARSIHVLLVTATLSCTGGPPTEVKSDLVTAAACGVTVTASPASVSAAPATDNTALFAVKNTCASATDAVDFTATRTGAVASTSTVTPSVIIAPGLKAGQSRNVTVAYRTGATPGTGTVVLFATRDATSPPTTSSGSQTVTVTTTTPLGLPFGPTDMYQSDYVTPKPNTAVFTASIDFTDPTSGSMNRIHAARVAHKHLVMAMTGGCHSNDANGVPNCNPSGPGGVQGPYRTNGQFDLAKWKAQMDRYNTLALKPFRDTVAAAIEDGTILGNSVLDEPPHPTWGGVMTKPLVDQMCAYVRGIFPQLPVGVVAVHWWRTQEHYNSCDFIVDQFEYDRGPGGSGPTDTPSSFRTAGEQVAQADHIRIVFSMNVLDGGKRVSGCTAGTITGNCWMTPADLQAAGIELTSNSASGLFMWRYDATMMGQTLYQNAFAAVASNLANKAKKSWLRP